RHHAWRSRAGHALGRGDRCCDRRFAGGRRPFGIGRTATMNAGVTTREFVMADYDGAIALWNNVEGVEICEGDSRDEIAEYLRRNPGLSRVAEAGGKIVGVALCGHDGRRGWIYHLAVAET